MILLVLIDINYDLFNNRIDNQSIIIYICYYSFNLIFKKSINIHINLTNITVKDG